MKASLARSGAALSFGADADHAFAELSAAIDTLSAVGARRAGAGVDTRASAGAARAARAASAAATPAAAAAAAIRQLTAHATLHVTLRAVEVTLSAGALHRGVLDR